ncbi:helix-turn-helix domain-containing protein [Candidatus Chloroploca sp. M-50]|uniref:Helix-turn-helix domain-containing protein n=1 Tax=Candidatus Chloroploca mongolica TaxID=2528176 RepID=A0ABS4DDV2_9CHLR|nr:helix-turn-helix domain-containing protein [Candidatus Chloroploca mongolica]MBP1467632.1 helix-turn-helix domain-containing protein [Candidatus Chloroploca mongolica]
MDQKFYTVEEVSEQLRLRGVKFAPRTIRKLIADGKLRAVRFGERTLYVSESELNRFLSEPDGPGQWRTLTIASR